MKKKINLNRHITINDYSIFDDSAKIVDVYGQGCNYPTKKGVDGFQVDLNLTATNRKNETKCFNICIQSSERTDCMMAYSGHEMYFGILYGADWDESEELANFLDCDEEKDSMFDLINFCEELCKKWYEDYLSLNEKYHKRGIEEADIELLDYVLLTYEDLDNFIKNQKKKAYSELKENIKNSIFKTDEEIKDFIYDYFLELNDVGDWIAKNEKASSIYFFDKEYIMNIMHDSASEVLEMYEEQA